MKTTEYKEEGLSFLEDGKVVAFFVTTDEGVEDYRALRDAWESGKLSWNRVNAIVRAICEG